MDLGIFLLLKTRLHFLNLTGPTVMRMAMTFWIGGMMHCLREGLLPVTQYPTESACLDGGTVDSGQPGQANKRNASHFY